MNINDYIIMSGLETETEWVEYKHDTYTWSLLKTTF